MRIAATLSAVTLLATPAAALGGDAWEGSEVTRIEVRSDVTRERLDELLELIAVAPGDALTAAAVARSLRNLEASGRVGPARAYVAPTEGGVELVLALAGRTVVDAVRLEGELGLKEAELRQEIEQGAGTPLYEDRVFRSVYAMQDALEAAGYLDAFVRVRVDDDPAKRRAVVVFEVEAGPPHEVATVNAPGLPPALREETLDRLRMAPGDRFRPGELRGERERLERRLAALGHRTAEVGWPSWSVRPGTEQVDVEFAVDPGPRFEIEVQGAETEKLEKAGVLPFAGAARFDEALALAAERDLRTHFQERGHYDVAVERRDTAEEGVRRIVYSIEPGPEVGLAAIRFEGADSFDRERLLALMKTAPPRALSRGSGRLVDAWLDEDLRNLRSFYALEGFAGSRIGPPQIDRGEGEIVLTIPVREGRRRRVGALSIDGEEALSEEALLAGLPLEVNGPYHPLRLEEAVDEIRARYEEAGYSAAQIDSRVLWSTDETLADVELNVLEGPRSLLDRIVLRGFTVTDPALIRVASGLEPGQPVSRRGLLEAQRRLYALGIFSRVDVELLPGTPYASERDVLVRVREGKRSRVTYGAGWDSEDGVRGLLGLSRGNLFGRGVSARLDLRASQRESQARLLFHEPYLGRWRLPTTLSLFGIEEDRESFSSERYGAQVQVDRFGERWRLGLLATRKSVELSPGQSLEPLDLDRQLQDAEIASLTPAFFLDLRDDPVDPTRGVSTNVTFEVAQPVLGAEADYRKLFGQQTLTLGVGDLGVVAISLRLGGIEPGPEAEVGDLPPQDLPSGRIPISERFFAGGRSTHRAYKRDTLGVVGESILLCPTLPVVDPETGDTRAATCDDPLASDDPGRLVPVGGNGLAVLNVDFRFPIAGAFGGTAFVDAGNVWADWQGMDPTEAKLGAGVGVRYRSPVGPIRLEVGWKLDREPLEDPYVVFLSLGNPF